MHLYWPIPERQTGGGGGYRRNNKRIFRELIKSNMEFPGVIKKRSCGISIRDLMVLGLKIYGEGGCNTILWSF